MEEEGRMVPHVLSLFDSPTLPRPGAFSDRREFADLVQKYDGFRLFDTRSSRSNLLHVRRAVGHASA